MQMSLWIKAGRALAMAAALVPAAAQAVTFDFEDIAPLTPTPFTETVGGLSATFTGSAFVCASGGLFVALTGNVLAQELCGPGVQTGPLGISFSKDLSSVSLDFATAAGPGTLTAEALENGNPVSTSTFNSTVPPGYFSGEGFASVAGRFNSLTLTSADLLAIDNISTPAVPEPASIAVLGAALAGLILIGRRRKVGELAVTPAEQ
jgi:hypothetical protein